jgi:hypothetical protein
MPPSALPSAFDLEHMYKKGYFPHLFNTRANANYVGTVPDKKFYSPNTMKTCTDCDLSCFKIGCRNNFLNWHSEMSLQNYKVDFQEELVEYCVSDVNILMHSCLKFRKILVDECNVCPLNEGTTIASACNLVFRRNFLKPETIAIIPKKGYRNVDVHSKISIKWLIEEAAKRQINIQHAANGREITLNAMKVDGYCENQNLVFEFHGCYFHGHGCLSNLRDKPLREDANDNA